MIVKSGETKTLQITRKAISGFSFTAYCQHNAANTTFADIPIDWNYVNVRCQLKRDNRYITVFQDSALPLMLESSFLNQLYDQGLRLSNPFIDAATGVKELRLQNGFISIEPGIIVEQGEELELEVQFLPGALSSVTSTSDSYIEFNEIEDIINPAYIPVIGSKAVSAGESRFQHPVGDNVTRVCFINIDSSKGEKSSDQILQAVNLQGDKISFTDNYYQLNMKRYLDFENANSARARGQSFKLLEESVPVNKVSLDLTLNSLNVDTGKNYIIHRAGIPHRATLQKSLARNEKHVAENISQYAAAL